MRANGRTWLRFQLRLAPVALFPFVLLILAVLFPPAAGARVFQRLAGTERIAAALRQAGARTAYTSQITLNGGKAHLTVLGIPAPVEDVSRLLRGSLGSTAFDSGSGGLLRARLDADGSVTRLLMAYLAPHAQTVAFLIEQSTAEAARTDRGAGFAPVPGVPNYPDASPQFSAADTRVNMTLNVSRTAADAAAVRAWYSAELGRAGWAPMLPDDDAGQAGGLHVYARGPAVCVLHVDAAAAGRRESTITLLHKAPGIE